MCFFGESEKKRKYLDSELMRISWDKLVLRGFVVLGALLLLGFIIYLIWFLV